MAGIRDTAGQLLAAVGRGGGAPLTAVAAARDLSAATDAALQAAVDRARAAGHSWREVGDVLGTSRQAAFQRFGRPIDPRTGLAMNRALPPGAADRAVAVFAAHDEGRWAEIIEQLDETMRGLHSPELLALGWTRLASMYGRLERIGAPYPRPGSADAVIIVPLFFEAGELRGVVRFGGDSKIAGMAIAGHPVTRRGQRSVMDGNGGRWPRDRRPWFGPKRFGFGYGPRTWQGFLVTALLVLSVVGTAAATGGHSPLMVLPIAAAILVPLIIIRIQRR